MTRSYQYKYIVSHIRSKHIGLKNGIVYTGAEQSLSLEKINGGESASFSLNSRKKLHPASTLSGSWPVSFS